MFKSGSFKGNPLYFGRKQGGLLDVIEKINKLNPKPEVKLVTDDKEAYQKFFQAALKKFGAKSPAEMDDEKKKKFFDYIDKNYKSDAEKNEGELPPALKKAIEKKKKAKGEAHDDEEEEGKKYGNVTVHGEQGEIAKPFSGPQRMKEVLAKMWKNSLRK